MAWFFFEKILFPVQFKILTIVAKLPVTIIFYKNDIYLQSNLDLNFTFLNYCEHVVDFFFNNCYEIFLIVQ